MAKSLQPLTVMHWKQKEALDHVSPHKRVHLTDTTCFKVHLRSPGHTFSAIPVYWLELFPVRYKPDVVTHNLPTDLA